MMLLAAYIQAHPFLVLHLWDRGYGIDGDDLCLLGYDVIQIGK
jgi:hypothetical protein